MKKLFIAGIIVPTITISLLALTGCSHYASKDEPATVSTEDSSATKGYHEEYVKLSDGNVIKCLWWNKSSDGGTMSCDWSSDKK